MTYAWSHLIVLSRARGTGILLLYIAMTKDVIITPTAIAKIYVAIAKLLYCHRLKAFTAIAKASGLK